MQVFILVRRTAPQRERERERQNSILVGWKCDGGVFEAEGDAVFPPKYQIKCVDSRLKGQKVIDPIDNLFLSFIFIPIILRI